MTEVLKVVEVTYVADYGGTNAWLLDEYYDGNKADTTKVLKREYISNLHIALRDYLDNGYEVKMIPSS